MHLKVSTYGVFSLSLASALTAHAPAQTYTWDGGLSHNNFTLNNFWSTPNNWVSGSVPISGQNTDITFTQSGSWTTADQNIVSPFILHSILFDAANSNFTAITDGTLNLRTNTSAVGPSIGSNSPIPVGISNPITLSNDLSLYGTGSLMLASNISGSAAINAMPVGTVNLSGNNSYTGGTVFDSGVVELDSAGALGSTGTLLFAGGTLRYSAQNTTDYSSRFANSGSAAYSLDTNAQNVTLGSVLSDLGGLNKLGAGILTLGNSGNNLSGGTSIQGGTVRLGANNAVSPGTVTLANVAGVTLDLAGFSAAINSLNGGGSAGGNVLTGGGTLTVGGTNSSSTFAGTITGGGTLAKTGTGTLTLTGAGSSMGVLSVGSGVLTVSASGTIATTATGTTYSAIDGPAGTGMIVTGAGSEFSASTYFIVGVNNSGSLTVQNGGKVTEANAIFQVGTNAGSSGTLLVQSGGTVSATGLIIGAFGGSAGSATVTGAGSALTSTGILFLGDPGNGSAGGTGQLTVANGASVTANGRMNIGTSASSVTVNSGTLTVGSVMSTFGAVPAIALSDPASGPAFTVGSNNSSTTFAGSIADAAGGPGTVNKVGVSILALTGHLSNTGGYSATGGTIDFYGATVQPSSGSLTAAVAATIQYDNGARVFGGYLRGPGKQLVAGPATFTGTTSAASASISVTGPATFASFTNGGAMSITAAGSNPTSFNLFTNEGSGSITLAASSQASAADFQSYGLLTINPSTAPAFTQLTNTGTTPLYFNGGSRTFIGTIATAGTFVAGIDLHGQNAEVAGGLFVNNGYVVDSTAASGATSGAVVVADYGALVKGAGFFQFSPVTQNGGRVQAGNSPGSASFGQLTFGPGGVSSYVFAIDDATGTAGPKPDANGLVSGWGLMKGVQQSIGATTTNGNFAWTADATNKLTFAIETLVNPTTVGTDVSGLMADFDPSRSYLWPAIQWAGNYSGPTNVAALDASTIFDASGFENPIAGTFGWSLDAAGQTLSLTYTPNAVPEPGTLALVGLAAAGLACRRKLGPVRKSAL